MLNPTETTGSDQGSVTSGDDESIRLMVQRWYRRVYAHCRATLVSSADAEDATQETFARGISRIDQLRSADAVGAWLRGIAHHVCVDTIRRKETRKGARCAVETLPGSGADGPSQRVEQSDQQDHLMRLIDRLPENLREVVLLHYYEEMTYDEMARWLGVARSTVNERLGKARQMLKRELMPDRRCADGV